MSGSREILIRRDPVIWGEYAEPSGGIRLENRATRAQVVQVTSLEALPVADASHRESEALMLQLLDVDPRAPFTTFELGELLGKPVNCLTQPLENLRERGLVVLAGLKVNPTGVRARSWITPRHANELAQQDKKL